MFTSDEVARLLRVAAVCRSPVEPAERAREMQELLALAIPHSTCGILLLARPSDQLSFAFHTGLEAALVEEYLRDVAGQDPLLRLVRTTPGRARTLEEVTPPARREDSAYWQLLRQAGIGHGLAVSWWESERAVVLGLGRGAGQPFSAHEGRLAELIVPFFARACGQAAQARRASLSARELQVARLVSQGRADHEIAAELGISFATVRSHLRRIFQRLGLHSRIQLARWLHDDGGP